jgi:uroporphyrinogen-III synthase
MAVLVTRPHPDNEATATALREGGFEVVLAPMLRFEPVAFQDDPDASYDAVIVTSANALRAIEPQLAGSRLLGLPLFAVGERTASAARQAGFGSVIAADGDAAALRDLVRTRLRSPQSEGAGTLLYLSGADLSHDLAGELGEFGFSVVSQTTYRMVPVTRLSAAAREGFAANAIEAVLHYSRRSARAFLEAARGDGVEISALAVPQCCLSANIASELRDAGATRVVVAGAPGEKAMLDAVNRALRPGLA